MFQANFVIAKGSVDESRMREQRVMLSAMKDYASNTSICRRRVILQVTTCNFTVDQQ